MKRRGWLEVALLFVVAGFSYSLPPAAPDPQPGVAGQGASLDVAADGRGFVGFINERELMWRPVALGGMPGGVEMKLLSRDGRTGALSLLERYPAGWKRDGKGYHGGDEEIFVLEGDLRIGERTYTERTYTYIPAGMSHGPVSSKKGCLALVFWSAAPDFTAAEESRPGASLSDYVEYKSYEQEPWVSALEAGFSRLPGIFMKILRRDPKSGAMTWIAGSMSGRPPRKWEAHASSEEGYCLEGEFQLAECLPGGMQIGTLTKGSYFYRPAKIRHVGPYSGTRSYVLWFFRVPQRLETEYFDECSEK